MNYGLGGSSHLSGVYTVRVAPNQRLRLYWDLNLKFQMLLALKIVTFEVESIELL